MPSTKPRLPQQQQEDSRSEASTIRDRQIAAAAHARKSKHGLLAQRNGTTLKDLAFASAQAGDAAATAGQGMGVSRDPS